MHARAQTENNGLVDVSGFNALTDVFGSLIFDEEDLESITGFQSLQTIDGTLQITNSPNLNSLAGLANLQFIVGDLFLGGGVDLTNLNELENLQNVTGNCLPISGDNSILGILTASNENIQAACFG